MQTDDGADAPQAPAIGTRGPELGVALLLMALGALVIVDSVRVGAGWGDDGPRSGYFPSYIGALLVGASGSIVFGQLLRWKRDRGVFAQRTQLRSVFAVLWPMALYVGLVPFGGIYAASALLIAWFMLRHGGYGWRLTPAVAIGVPVILFLVFERWFLVPLPKGPLERLLGF